MMLMPRPVSLDEMRTVTPKRRYKCSCSMQPVLKLQDSQRKGPFRHYGHQEAVTHKMAQTQKQNKRSQDEDSVTFSKGVRPGPLWTPPEAQAGRGLHLCWAFLAPQGDPQL